MFISFYNASIAYSNRRIRRKTPLTLQVKIFKKLTCRIDNMSYICNPKTTGCSTVSRTA